MLHIAMEPTRPAGLFGDERFEEFLKEQADEREGAGQAVVAVDQMQFRLVVTGVGGNLGFGNDIVLPGMHDHRALGYRRRGRCVSR